MVDLKSGQIVRIDEAALRQIVDVTPSMIGVYNLKTEQYLFVSKAVTPILGYQPEDFLRKGVGYAVSLVHPDDLPSLVSKNEKALNKANNSKKHGALDKTIVSFEYRMKRKDGVWRWLYTTGAIFSRDGDGKVECVINISIDISDRKEVEEELLEMRRKLEDRVIQKSAALKQKEVEASQVHELLLESQERYQAFIATSSEAIWRFELDKPIATKLPAAKQIDLVYQHAYLAECNDACAQMYGFQKAADIVGVRLPQMLVRDDPNNIEYLTSFVKSGYRLVNAESCEMDKDGNTKYFANNLIGIVENGYVLRAWGTQRDITEQKRIEQQKDDFIAIASHELKTPLTSIKAFAQIMQRRFASSLDPKLAEYIAKMDTQVSRLNELVSDLLDVTKIGSGKLKLHRQTFHLGDLVQEIVETMRLTSKQHRILRRGEGDVKIRSDRERIGQVLTNLISNAIKYSPNANKVIVAVQMKKDVVVVKVQDFGIGISESEQERIFDRFYRADQNQKDAFPGLGLGLYISAEIIDRLDGRLWVESVKGKGSTFGIELPL